MKFVPHFQITHKISKVIDKKTETFDVSMLEENQRYNETEDYVTIFEKITFPDIKTSIEFDIEDIEMMDTNEKSIRYNKELSIGEQFLLVAFPEERNYNPYIHHDYFREDSKLYEFRFFIKGSIYEIIGNDDKKIKFKVEEIIPFLYRKNTCINLIEDFVLEPTHIVKFNNERFQGDIRTYFDEEDSSTFKISNLGSKYIEAHPNGDIFITLNEQLHGSKMKLSFDFDKTDANYSVVVNKIIE